MSSQRVFKRKRRIGDQVVMSSNYYGEYKLEGDRKETRVALRVSDKRVAEHKLREIVKQAERERAGLVLPAREVAAAQRPLTDHLADFIADQKSRGHNRSYVTNLNNRNKRLMRECQWQYVRHVTGESFTAWRQRQLCMSPKTRNDYLQAVHTFLTWMANNLLISRNPLEHVGKVEQRGMETFKRRYCTPVEFERLLEVSGPRAVVYLAAVYTGFRRSALYELQWVDVDLDRENPTAILHARHAKNKVRQVQPLHPDLATALRCIKPTDAKPSDRVFKGRLRREKLITFRADLKRAGIPFENEHGRFDFHALRHTAATWAGATGVAGALLQSFTGHKTASQLARYIHVENLPTRQVVLKLPRFEKVVSGPEYGPQWTGKGTVSVDLPSHALSSSDAMSHAGDIQKPLKNRGKMNVEAVCGTTCLDSEKNAPRGTRTHTSFWDSRF